MKARNRLEEVALSAVALAAWTSAVASAQQLVEARGLLAIVLFG